MKIIGIIGGLGFPSTAKYYELLNEGVQNRLGKGRSARILLTSVDGADVARFRTAGDAAGEGAFFAEEARRLERAGADFLMIASNNSHRNAPYVEKAVSIPLLHLGDATAARVAGEGISRIGLLGTAPVMQESFYKDRLAAKGLQVLVPGMDERQRLNSAIYDELCNNIVLPETRALFRAAAENLRQKGAEGVILGCTELTLLDLGQMTDVKLFDTVKIHVDAALDAALEHKPQPFPTPL